MNNNIPSCNRPNNEESNKNRCGLPTHSGYLRLLHTLNALTVIGLVSSGWAIYNAAPIYAITFPMSLSLGNYLTEALRWHFALMWIFFITSFSFIVLRLSKSWGGPSLTPISIRSIICDLKLALQFKITHQSGHYNHVQRLLYVCTFILLACLLITGLTLWKPVQLHFLTHIMGGFPTVRIIHFWAMIGICIFTVIHLIMIVVVPRTLLTMIFGGKVMRINNNSSPTKRDSK
ncbi:cytochrome b/b6 domain-containing protein [Agarilytica rhodophyticola]|uniref:cytochrome b/b6 domain-containing protein n=1 Tax=Agarilytica rhodophyticola TaxID=1737490 RepID=UPI000B342A49